MEIRAVTGANIIAVDAAATRSDDDLAVTMIAIYGQDEEFGVGGAADIYAYI